MAKRSFGFEKYSALYLLGIFLVVFGATKFHIFFSMTTFRSVLIEKVLVAILAIAFLIPLTTGTFDLSVGALMALGLVTTNWLGKHTHLPNLAIVGLALLLCGFVGFLSGWVVVKLRVNSFIATLGMSQVVGAFVLFTSSNRQIVSAFRKSYLRVGQNKILGLPLYFYYMLIIAIVLWYVLEHTPLGRFMFATGGNPEAARLAGVRTDRLVWGSLVASGFVGGFAGVVFSWKVGTFSQTVGPGFLFPAVAAVFFGASQLKGRPNVWGALIAMYALSFGIKGLQLTSGSSTFWIEPLFEGVTLLAAVALASRSGIIKIPKRNKTAEAAAVAATEAPASIASAP
jgi:ribose transport system permease protein